MNNKKSPMQKFTLKDFRQMFPDDASCLDYLRREWFPEVIKCGKCGRDAKFYRITTRKVYGCEFCGWQFSPASGTIFHKSPTPLTTWFYVIYLMAQTRGGISSKQIQRETGVTYKCAWRMCRQVRSMLFEESEKFSDITKADESYFGGAEKNKHASKRTVSAQGRSLETKAVAFGMANRGGKLEAPVVKNAKAETIPAIVWKNVMRGSEVHTDEYRCQ